MTSLQADGLWISCDSVNACLCSDDFCNGQEYIRELGMLLVHLGNRHDPATQASLERLTVESTQLLGCLKAFSPAVYRSVCQGRLDAGQRLPAQELDAPWFASLQASTCGQHTTLHSL